MLRLLDRRFEGLAQRLEAHTVNLAKHHESVTMHTIAGYQDSLNATRLELRAESEAVAEYVLAMARIERRIMDALHDAAPRARGLHDETRGDASLVERPHAHAAAAAARGGRVLMIGVTGGALALELASIGHQVTVVDSDACAPLHPNIAVASSPADVAGSGAQFDLIVCSSAEGGRSHNGIDEERSRLEEIARGLHPGGKLLLSVPFGAASPDGDDTVHDEKSLAALVGGFAEEARHLYRRADAATWLPVPPEHDVDWSIGGPGVAIVVLAVR